MHYISIILITASFINTASASSRGFREPRQPRGYTFSAPSMPSIRPITTPPPSFSVVPPTLSAPRPTLSFILPPTTQASVDRAISSVSGTPPPLPRSVVLRPVPSPSLIFTPGIDRSIERASINTQVVHSDPSYDHKIATCALTSAGLGVPNCMLSTYSAHYDVASEIVDYVKDALGTKPIPMTDFERQEALNKWSKAKITKVQDIVAKEKIIKDLRSSLVISPTDIASQHVLQRLDREAKEREASRREAENPTMEPEVQRFFIQLQEKTKNGLDTTQERAAFEDYQYRKRIAIDYKIELHRIAVEKALRDLQKIHALYKQ